MTRKSAAKAKAVKNNNSDKFLVKPELPPIEETFENIKQVMVNTAEVQVQVAGRVENLVNIRLAAYQFYGNELDEKCLPKERMDFFKELMEITIEAYKQILDIVNSFELDEFLKEDMKDYFEDLMPSVENIITEEDLFVAKLIVDCVKPWGEKMNQLHYQMVDEQGQRKAMESEEL